MTPETTQNSLMKLETHAVKLAVLAEALDPLLEASQENCGPQSHRARNALPEAVEVVIERAWALVAQIADMREPSAKVKGAGCIVVPSEPEATGA